MSDKKNSYPAPVIESPRRIPDLSPFIGRRIKNLRCSIGVQLPGLTVTSVDAEKHGVEMIQGPMAVLVKKGELEKLIYIGNLIEATLYPQTE